MEAVFFHFNSLIAPLPGGVTPSLTPPFGAYGSPYGYSHMDPIWIPIWFPKWIPYGSDMDSNMVPHMDSNMVPHMDSNMDPHGDATEMLWVWMGMGMEIPLPRQPCRPSFLY